jgi:hypothetical protein
MEWERVSFLLGYTYRPVQLMFPKGFLHLILASEVFIWKMEEMGRTVESVCVLTSERSCLLPHLASVITL